MSRQPSSGTSSRLMQRSRVLLPDPLGPMITTTSPRAISRSMPASAARVPKRLRMPDNRKTGPSIGSSMATRGSAFEILDQDRARIAHQEVDQRSDQVDIHSAEGYGDAKLGGAHQLDDRDRRDQCRILQHRNEIVADRRQDDTRGLRD